MLKLKLTPDISIVKKEMISPLTGSFFFKQFYYFIKHTKHLPVIK